MPLTKQAKTLTPAQTKAVLAHLDDTRYPARDRAMFLLSVKAGLRACEIGALTWAMVTDAAGNLADSIELPNLASKGRKGGRSIPMNKDLRQALATLQGEAGDKAQPHRPIAVSERGTAMSAPVITNWFARLYDNLGMDGCSSHSGRRTFLTQIARKIAQAGGSLRDVQRLAGHTSLNTTQRYIEADSEASRKVVDLI